MKTVKYSVMYRPLHPETGQPLLNTDVVQPILDKYLVYDANTLKDYKTFPDAQKMPVILEQVPNCICAISRQIMETKFTYSPSSTPVNVFGYALKPLKVNVPNVWVIYNTFSSIDDCVKAVESLAKVYGVENLKIVKEIDHRLTFRLG